MHIALVVHAVLPMKVSCIGIDGMKHFKGIHQIVLVAKETIDTPLVLWGNSCETLFGNLFVSFDECLVNIEFLDAVQSGILKLLCSSHTMCLHRFSYLQGRIDADAVETTQLFCVHATHRGADNQVGLLLLTNSVKQRNGLVGLNRQVGSQHAGIGHHRAQSRHSTRLSTTAKAVDIKYSLALHQLRKLFDIRIFHVFVELLCAKIIKKSLLSVIYTKNYLYLHPNVTN